MRRRAVQALARMLEMPLAVRDTPVEPLDAIVVLGAPLARDGSLSRVLAERVAATVELYRAGAAPLVVASGGITHGAPCAEADVIADALRDAGIADVLVERASRTTAENAELTAALLLPRGARRVWLVTQPFHGRRAALLFRRAGFEPQLWHLASSVQYSDRRHALRWLVREYAAWGAMLLRSRRSAR